MLFNDTDRARIAAAIAQAEANTAGEIVVIINTRPHRYAATMLATAVLAAFTLPFVAVLAGWTPSLLFPDWDTIDAATRGRTASKALPPCRRWCLLSRWRWWPACGWTGRSPRVACGGIGCTMPR